MFYILNMPHFPSGVKEKTNPVDKYYLSGAHHSHSRLPLFIFNVCF